MDEHSGCEPLLLRKEGFDIYCKKESILLSLAKWVLKVVMWAIFVAWAGFIFLLPSDFARDLYFKWIFATRGTLFGMTGSLFAIFSAPILLIAFLGVIYLVISGNDEIHVKKKNSRYLRPRLWTFPVLVDGPFGVVSAAETIGIVIFITYVIWALCINIVQDFSSVGLFPSPSREQSLMVLKRIGLNLGGIGLYCLAFLFLPVARGSVLLRLIDIPFEHAARYHVWLGHLTMFIFTLHGLVFVVLWTMHGHLIEKLTDWKTIGVANLPGVISLAAGLLMWVTSLPGVRRTKFELFFYTHQLYVVFVVFLALHVGDFLFSIAAGGIFLFMLDRFLRFCQSRRRIDVLSARCFPCGTVELVLSKPANLRYSALSWIFLQIRELSWLQWHPFSVSSSPLDGKHHLAIMIKVLGDWTSKLEKKISGISEREPQTEPLLQSVSKLTASVEGPYGHESSYHLMYENLILVAGGIGISPFLAILSDVLHRINDGKPCSPRNILIIWAVKTSNEIQLLQTVDVESICPIFSHTLNLEVQTYVTRESGPSLEEGKPVKPVHSAAFLAANSRGMSPLVGTGDVIWSGIYIVASTIGFITMFSLLSIFYLNPNNILSWWFRGLLFVACMVASVLVFGGTVIGLWNIWERKTPKEPFKENSTQSQNTPQNAPNVNKNSVQEQIMNTIQYGQRPDFKGIFMSMSERWGSVDIGVIVCGPHTLQTSIARECRTQNLGRRANQAVFHFNSHSFDL